MKKLSLIFIGFILVLTLFSGFNFGNLYALDEGVTLKVSGWASVEVSPNKAEVYGSIKTCSFNTSEAKDLANETFTYLENVIKNESSCEIVKAYDFIQPYGYDCYMDDDVAVYYINVKIKFDNLSRLKPVLEILKNIDDFNLNDINYMVSDNSEYYIDALNKAINNSIEKAQKIHGNDVTMIRVEETNNYWCGASRYERIKDDLSFDDIKISIYANVNAEFVTN